MIHQILEHSGLANIADEIIANPASYNSTGCLEVGLLNTHNCLHCFNGEMCKGVVIRNYLNDKEKSGVVYDKIFFTGDYLNDVCLALELSNNDVVIARHEFALHKDLKPRVENGQLRATMFTWKSGFDVWRIIEKYIE